jgi:hypothetical protein
MRKVSRAETTLIPSQANAANFPGRFSAVIRTISDLFKVLANSYPQLIVRLKPVLDELNPWQK